MPGTSLGAVSPASPGSSRGGDLFLTAGLYRVGLSGVVNGGLLLGVAISKVSGP